MFGCCAVQCSVIDVSASYLAGEVEFRSENGSRAVRCPRHALVQVSGECI